MVPITGTEDNWLISQLRSEQNQLFPLSLPPTHSLPMSATDWTSEEEAVARQAFELGKQRSITTLIENLKDLSTRLDTPESIWQFHDYLSTERYQYEGRMEFDFSNILFTLADMIKQKLIQYDDLNGLNQVKVSKIKAMSMF